MSMYCYQCQEALGNVACTALAGICGKTNAVANLQDLLIYTLKGVAEYNQQARKASINEEKTNRLIIEGLFTTITNANFDRESITKKIETAVNEREAIKARLIENGSLEDKEYPDYATWSTWSSHTLSYEGKSVEKQVGFLSTTDEDMRSLRSLILFGIKGMAAYAEHAQNLGHENEEIFDFIEKALLATE